MRVLGILFLVCWVVSGCSSPSKPRPEPFRVPSDCTVTADHVRIHGRFDLRAAHDEELFAVLPAYRTRSYPVIWTVQCDRRTGECSGSTLDLSDILRERRMNSLDLTSMVGAKLAESPGLYTIDWGVHQVTLSSEGYLSYQGRSVLTPAKWFARIKCSEFFEDKPVQRTLVMDPSEWEVVK